MNARSPTSSPLPVALWLARPEAATERAATPLLSPAERARADRFLHDGARRQFLTGRWLVRSRLSASAPEIAPAAWRFDVNAHGCPHITPAQNRRRLVFNLSHTDGLVALVVAVDAAVGVDVEDRQRKSRTVQIADRFFAPAEVAALRALPEADQRDAFFDYWTLKEAYIKARGMGLALPLKRFAFTVDRAADADGISLDVDPRLDDDGRRWWFTRRDPTPRHRVAVAARANGRQVSLAVDWVSPT